MIGYPSDIIRQQFKLIRPDLEAMRQRTRPRQVDLYEILNAVLYILRTGSQWRQLLHDFPNWQTVYGYFHRWSEPINVVGHNQLDLILKKCQSRSITYGPFGTHFIYHSRYPKCQKC